MMPGPVYSSPFPQAAGYAPAPMFSSISAVKAPYNSFSVLQEMPGSASYSKVGGEVYGSNRDVYGSNRDVHGSNREVYGSNREGYGSSREGYGSSRPSPRNANALFSLPQAYPGNRQDQNVGSVRSPVFNDLDRRSLGGPVQPSCEYMYVHMYVYVRSTLVLCVSPVLNDLDRRSLGGPVQPSCEHMYVHACICMCM